MKVRIKSRPTRDSMLFALGTLGIIYETVVSQTDRPTLLVLFAGCIGLPHFLHTDEKQTEKEAEATKPPPVVEEEKS